MEAISWIERCFNAGVGDVEVISIDTDGVKNGTVTLKSFGAVRIWRHA